MSDLKRLDATELATEVAPTRRRRGTGSIYHDGTSWVVSIHRRDGAKVRRRAVSREAAENRLRTLLEEFQRAGQLGYGYQPPGTRGLMWMYRKPGETRKRAGVTARVRFQVFERDGFRCGYCGATPKTAQLHVDHIVPVSKGGTDHPSNLATACSECNLGKADLELPQ